MGGKSMSVSSKPGFFGTITDSQSYLNVIYLLLALPLGIFYFAFLVTGLSLGIGLSITLAGIPILLVVLAGSLVLGRLERILAKKLLRVDIPTPPRRAASPGFWSRFKALLSDRLVWKDTLYLLFKFPIGIATFTLAVTLLAVSIGFVFAPAYMWMSDPLVWGGRVYSAYPWAWILTAVGIPIAFGSLRLMNAVAAGLGGMTRYMLGKAK